MEKLNSLDRLILMHIAINGRIAIDDLAEKCGCTRKKLYSYLPRLERGEYIVSFNIWRQAHGKQVTTYYKLYAIHYNYIDHMKRYFATLVDPKDWDETWRISRSANFEFSFVVNTDRYEWSIDKQVLLKNGQPVDGVDRIRKQTAEWMRSKKGDSKTILLPRYINEEETAKVKNTVYEVQRNIQRRILSTDWDGD